MQYWGLYYKDLKFSTNFEIEWYFAFHQAFAADNY